MKVLSLFDGISCGMLALERAGIKVDKYYASEIDDKAIKISKKNYPEIIQLGDVRNISTQTLMELGEIDLLIGGSPCQDLTRAKQDRERKGLLGDKSSLFFQFVRILTECKPKYFLLENVVMEKKWEDYISDCLGVKPIRINSNLTSAADRERLYWTNIPVVGEPEDRHLVLRDIVEPSTLVPGKYWYTKPFKYLGDYEKIQCELEINTHNLLKKVYNLNGKCGTLTCVHGGYQEKKVYQDGRCRKLMPVEYERLMNLPDGYTEGVNDSARYTACGNGWTVDVIAFLFSFLKGGE